MMDTLDLSAHPSLSPEKSQRHGHQQLNNLDKLNNRADEEEEDDGIGITSSFAGGSNSCEGASSCVTTSICSFPTSLWCPSPISVTAFDPSAIISAGSGRKPAICAEAAATTNKKRVRFETHVWEITEIDSGDDADDEGNSSLSSTNDMFYTADDYESFRSDTRKLLCPTEDEDAAPCSLMESFGSIVDLLEEVYCQLAKNSIIDEVDNALELLDASLKDSLDHTMKKIIDCRKNENCDEGDTATKRKVLDPEEWIGFGHRLSGLIYPQMARRREKLQLVVQHIQKLEYEDDEENVEEELFLSCRYYTQTPTLFAQILAHMQMMMPDDDDNHTD